MNDLITFNYGTMGSAKTANLLINAYNIEEKGGKVLLIKPDIDTRDGVDIIQSRIEGLSRKCKLLSEVIVNNEFSSFVYEYDYFFIDEAQFLDKKSIDKFTELADKYEKILNFYGLKTDYKSNLFEGSKRLIEIADKLVEIEYLCSCGKKAIFNARYDNNGNIIREGSQIILGKEDKYVALCRKCYKEKKIKIK